MIHARIQEFSSGGGKGGVQVHLAYIKKALTAFFFYSFKSSIYFTEVQWLLSKKTIICQGSSGGGTFSRGSNFLQGVQLLFPYRSPYSL